MQLEHLWNDQLAFVVGNNKVCTFQLFFLRHLVINNCLNVIGGSMGIPTQYPFHPEPHRGSNHDHFVQPLPGSCLKNQSSFFDYIRIVPVLLYPMVVILCHSRVHHSVQFLQFDRIIKNRLSQEDSIDATVR